MTPIEIQTRAQELIEQRKKVVKLAMDVEMAKGQYDDAMHSFIKDLFGDDRTEVDLMEIVARVSTAS